MTIRAFKNISCLMLLLIKAALAGDVEVETVLVSTHTEKKIEFVISGEMLEKHASSLRSLRESKNLPIGKIVAKGEIFVNEELVYKTSPSLSKQHFKKTNRKSVFAKDLLTLSSLQLEVDSSDHTFWKAIYLAEGMGGPTYFTVLILLDGTIAPYREVASNHPTK